MGDKKRVITDYEAILGTRLSDLASYLRLADSLWQEGDQEDAVAIWQDEVLRHDPANLYANWRLLQYESNGNVDRRALFPVTLDSIRPSTDPRAVDYQAQAIVGMRKDNFWSQETQLTILAHQAWYSDSPTTEILFKHLIELASQDADIWYYLGEYYRRQNKLSLAEDAYQQTINLAPDYSPAYLRLGMMDETRFKNGEGQAWLDEALVWYQKYHQLAPDTPIGFRKLLDLCQSSGCDIIDDLVVSEEHLTNRKPEFMINQTLHGWLFQGYDVDETRLIRGEPVWLYLHWLAPAEAQAIPEDDNFYQLGQHWVQMVEVQNIILDGGFEMSQTPLGFPRDIYRSDPAGRQLTTDSRNGQKTTVALLSNTSEFSRTSLATEWFQVNQDKFYLQAGWIRSESERSFMGQRWLGDIEASARYSYVADLTTPITWTHYAEIITPPRGATQSEFRLLNESTIEGQVYFDNLIFVEIDKPKFLE
jgi:tetratricopeptide (TPR) repeat protein